MNRSEAARTVLAWSGIAAATAVIAPPAAVIGMATARRWHRTDLLPRAWTRALVRSCGARVVVRGLDRFDHDRNYVMVCNHLSFLDPPAIVAVLPQKIRFLAKRELLWVPVFGLAAWATGNIFVKREKKGSARRSLARAADHVGRDVSVLFFAEGTRSADGTLGPFKPGAAQMALSAQVPVLPMAIAGTAEIFPRGGGPIRPGTVGLAVGRPISVTGRTTRDREALSDEVREAVLALLPEADAARRAGTGDRVFPG